MNMTTTATDDYSPVADIAAQHSEAVIDADFLLREIVQAGRRPTYPELTYFRRECGWDETAVQKQLRRMNSVLRLQAIAGTLRDREASVKESETAAAVLETEGPKLAAKIEKLQQQLDAMERDAHLSAKRVDEQRQAADQLRALVPEHIAGSVRAEINAIESTLGRELRDAETRINELRCCLTPSLYNSEAAYLETLERSFRAAVSRGEQNRIIKRALSPAWPDIRAGIETELATLQTSLNELKSQYAEAIEQAEQPLDFYSQGQQERN